VEIPPTGPYALIAPIWYYSGFENFPVLSLTRKTDYALVALASLARPRNSRPRNPRPRSGSLRSGPDDTPRASAHDLAESLHLPLPVLRNILKTLALHGLLTSTQGPSGGYGLARPADQITLADVIDAIEGPVRLAVCCPIPEGETVQHCFRENSCKIKATVRRVHESLREFLATVTLADIASDRIPLAARRKSRNGRVTQTQLVTLA
jgi:Rrf2 family protein